MAVVTTTTKNTHLYQGGCCCIRLGSTVPTKSRETVAVATAMTLVQAFSAEKTNCNHSCFYLNNTKKERTVATMTITIMKEDAEAHLKSLFKAAQEDSFTNVCIPYHTHPRL